VHPVRPWARRDAGRRATWHAPDRAQPAADDAASRRHGAHAESEECGGIVEGAAARVGRRSAASGLHDRASWHILPMTPKIAVECGPCQLEMSC
jgi:hypothetical protein